MNKYKELRKKLNLNQEELAEKVSVTQTSVSRWEKGKSTPDYETLKKLAHLFNVTTDYLLGNEQLPATVSTGVPEKVTPEKAKEIWLASLAPDDRETINYYFMLSYNDRQKVNGYIVAKLSMAEI